MTIFEYAEQQPQKSIECNLKNNYIIFSENCNKYSTI